MASKRIKKPRQKPASHRTTLKKPAEKPWPPPRATDRERLELLERAVAGSVAALDQALKQISGALALAESSPGERMIREFLCEINMHVWTARWTLPPKSDAHRLLAKVSNA